ncbi:MAG: hypothetical protein KUG73_07575 [Pseudomonadales bacterium]|nr:hypothetical protein [Pseudomonadales bacterium]
MISNIRYVMGIFGIFMCGLSGILNAQSEAQSELRQNSQSKWRILIVAESDNLGLRAGHPAYKRANNAIFTQLQRAGFDVLSLAADKTLPLCLMDVCKQQTEQDIVALANASGLDVDLVILFSIRYTERVGAGVIHREISVPSRMIDVKSGRRVGLWDDDGVLTEPISETCIDRCLQSALSDYARQIGRDSGLAISIKLQEYQRWFDYQLTFLKFAKGELLAVENYFNNYFQNSFKNNFIRAADSKAGSMAGSKVDSEIDRKSPRQFLFHTIVNRKIIIESLLSPQEFRQRLEQVLGDEGLSANIQTSGYAFILHREGLPYVWRYTFLVIMLVVLMAASYFRVVRYQHNRILAQLACMKKNLMDQTLGKSVDETPYPLLVAAEKLLSSVNGSAKLQQQKNDVSVARNAFIKALPVLMGRSIIKSEKLTASVNVLVDDIVQVGRHSADSPPEIEGNDVITSDVTTHDLKSNDLKSNDLEINDLKIGDTENNNDTIAIGFTRLSHIGKQNRIERLQDGFTLTDEGSTNGSFLDDVLTVADQSVSLAFSEHMLCMGGSRAPLESGVCQLRLYVKNTNVSSLIIEIDREAVALADPSMLNKHWPNLAYDQNQQWLLLGTALEIGIDANGHLDIGCLRGSKVRARLSYFHPSHSHKADSHKAHSYKTHSHKTITSQGRCPGYWLEPVVGESVKSIDISVNQTQVFTAVPLIQGANVSIDGVVFSFTSISSK